MTGFDGVGRHVGRRDVMGVLGMGLLAGCVPVLGAGPVIGQPAVAGPLDAVAEAEIRQIAVGSAIAGYRWKDRGRAPTGYMQGMALAYARQVVALGQGEVTARAIAVAVPASGQDALAWYAPALQAAGGGVDTAAGRLRDVFALMLGLGMRESSGKTCEGRDRSTNNVTADTAEAGLFQVSYNSVSASPELPRLFAAYQGRSDLLEVFSQGVVCRASSAENFGTGAGRDFQALTKACPAFAVEYTAVLMRYLRSHWGPLNRHEVEVRADAYVMLDAVAARLGV